MIHVEENGDVTTVRMEHGKVQAMDIELLHDLSEVLDKLRKSPPGAVILTGTGTAFSAGVDLVRLTDGGQAYVERFFPALCIGLRKLFTFPRPVIAAMNGHAIAGGAILACTCDYKIMAAGNARVGVPELMVGVAFPSVVVEVLRFAIPAERIQEIMYLGQTYPAERAVSLGFADELVPPEQLTARAHEIASRMAAAPRAAFEIGKKQLRQMYVERADRFEAELGEAVFRQWMSTGTHDFIRAYLERTLRRK